MYVHIFLGHHAGVRCDQRENIREHQKLDQKHRRGTGLPFQSTGGRGEGNPLLYKAVHLYLK